MRQRARHWTSLGYLYILYDMTPSTLIAAYDYWQRQPDHKAFNVPRYDKPDRILVDVFIHMTPEQVDGIMKAYPESVPPGGLPKLREACQRVIDDGKTHATAYTRDTVIDFHRLLISVILGYTHALQRLFDLKQTEDTENEAVRNAGETVWNYANFLWCITRSRTLRYHLAVLENGYLLDRPQNLPQYVDRLGIKHFCQRPCLSARAPRKRKEMQTSTLV